MNADIKTIIELVGRQYERLVRERINVATQSVSSVRDKLAAIKSRIDAVYAHLFSRGCTQSTPTTENLLSTIQQLATRKIDAGASTQIPDGISLVRLLCDTTAASAVTELIDTNTGWTMGYNPLNLFTQLTKLHLNCTSIPFTFINGNNTLTDVQLPHLTYVAAQGSHFLVNNTSIDSMTCPELEQIAIHQSNAIYNNSALKYLSLPKLKYVGIGNGNAYSAKFCTQCPQLEEILMPSFTYMREFQGNTFINGLPELKKVHLGNPTLVYRNFFNGILYNCPKLLHVEFSDGMNKSQNLSGWQPTLTDTNLTTFLSNFRQYIFLRLADRTATTALTLTLSSAVYTALTTETSTLAELGITTLTDKEQAAGITLATAYNTWLDTYRAAINWNITNAG